jgi:hypothetical protein
MRQELGPHRAQQRAARRKLPIKRAPRGWPPAALDAIAG